MRPLSFFFGRPQARRYRRRRRVVAERKSKLVFEHGQSFAINGRVFNVSVAETETDRSRARLVGDTVSISLPLGLRDREKRELSSYLARRVITKAVLPNVDKRVRELNDMHFKSEINRVSLKDNSTLWASCSHRNNISLDFRLIFAPQQVFDAIIIHELAHTKQRNHSKEFWELVTAVVPDYKQHRKWLRENAGQLKPVPTGQSAQAPFL